MSIIYIELTRFNAIFSLLFLFSGETELFNPFGFEGTPVLN
jgi:hypothetical protein